MNDDYLERAKWVFRFEHECKRRQMTLHYIKPDEAETLLAIAKASRKGWAKKIVKRNQRALKALRDNDTGCFKIGCPHCMASKGYCYECAFVKAPPDDHPVFLDGSAEICIRLPFGGVEYMNAQVYYGDVYIEIPTAFMGNRQRAKTETFLRAHVEWAKKMIAVYGK